MAKSTFLLNIRQTAHSLGVPVAWLRREAEAGAVPRLRVGRRWMFDPNAVMKALAERQEKEAPRG